MYNCEICGREIFKKNRIGGYTVCGKHMHQYYKYGKFLDNIPRTNKDLNEFRYINDKIIEFDVYYQNNTVCDSFIIDREDLNKIRYKKWRKDSNNHIITGNNTQKTPRVEISRLLLNVTDEKYVVDHINGNPLDNRKCNLRICTQANNCCNKSKISNNSSGFIGVSWAKDKNAWAVEINKNKTRCHLSTYKKLEEAVYVRYIAEQLIFKEYRNTNEDAKKEEKISLISQSRKNELYNYVYTKLNSKNMIK